MKSKGVLSNLTWKFAERITAQLVSTIVSIVLARLLEPEHYGIISIVLIFITIANVFVSDGFGSALIQKKDADQTDFWTVLYFNIVFSAFLYGILFAAAPFITRFYGDGYELLTPVLRVLGLRLLLTAINSVQQAYVSKNMIFEKFFWATLFGTIISGVVGIALAYNGAGVWALVAQYLTNTTVDTIVLAIVLKKTPKLLFSWNRLKNLYGYGVRILGTSLLINCFEEFRALLIGKVYNSASLAFYDKAQQFPKLIIVNINASIGAVLFPKMSSEQDSIVRLKETARNSVRFSSFTMCPLMLGLAAIADTFIYVILTDKWIPCVGMMRLFCLFFLFQPIHTANIQAIKALGRSDIYLRLEIIKKTIELITLLIVIRISVLCMVISMVVLAAGFTIVNAYPNKRLIEYSFGEQMKDIGPGIILASIMAVIVFFIGRLPINKVVLLCLQVVSGAVIYLVLSVLTKNREFLMIKSIIKSKLHLIQS